MWITDIKVVEGTSEQRAKNNCPAGYTLIPVDLNQGAGGRWIYLCYFKGSDAIDNIVSLALCFNRGSGQYSYNIGNLVQVDLNKGAGGDFIYLAYVMSSAANSTPIEQAPWNQWYMLGDPISELQVLTTPRNNPAPNTPAGWIRVEGYEYRAHETPNMITVDPDLNRGTSRGNRIYLYYRRKAKPVVQH